MNLEKPTFTKEQVDMFERAIDKYISKGYYQISTSTGIVSKEIEMFQRYLNFYYPSGTFSKNPNFRNYRITQKNGKKYTKKENW